MANVCISTTIEKWVGFISLQRQGAVQRRRSDLWKKIEPITGYLTEILIAILTPIQSIDQNSPGMD